MAKPPKINLEGKDFFAWKYEEQTQIKHRVLSAYAKIWLSKLGFYKNTIFFDCHGGCGAYIDSSNTISYGSSILVNKLAETINKNRKTQTGFYYCEIDKKSYDNFLKVKDYLNCSKMITYNDSFENIIQKDSIKKIYNFYPTLFFIDPFGYNFNIDSLKGLMYGFGNELIINFMFDYINRFISFSQNEDCYNKFFGCENWKNAATLQGHEREIYLLNLFKSKVKEITKSKYVFAYRLCYPDKNQTYYYLIHATNHLDGITLMKTSFASINHGHVEYLGKNNDVPSLFDIEQVKTDEMYNQVFKKFVGEPIKFINLWENIVEDTAYTDKDLNIVLHELEISGKAKITRITSKRGNFKKDDLIEIGE